MKPNLGTLLNFDNPLNQGLVTCFPNSEQSGEAVYDISKYGYKGTLFGNAWTLPSVEYDRYALDYNGSSNVVITDINNTVTEATFTAWVKA